METVTIEGRQPVLEALKAGRHIKRVLIIKGSTGGIIDKIQGQAKRSKIEVLNVHQAKFEAVAKTRSHQGVIAEALPIEYVGVKEILNSCPKGGHPFILVLDQIQDPQNFGSIIRTADAAGVHGIIIPKKNSVQITPGVEKASAGAVQYVPVAQSNIAQALDFFQGQGCWVMGADMDGPKEYFEMDFNIPLVLVIGSEDRGMRRLVKKKCDHLVRIPQFGKINSLNAANAASILMYEVLRQRLQKQ